MQRTGPGPGPTGFRQRQREAGRHVSRALAPGPCEVSVPESDLEGTCVSLWKWPCEEGEPLPGSHNRVEVPRAYVDARATISPLNHSVFQSKTCPCPCTFLPLLQARGTQKHRAIGSQPLCTEHTYHTQPLSSRSDLVVIGQARKYSSERWTACPDHTASAWEGRASLSRSSYTAPPSQTLAPVFPDSTYSNPGLGRRRIGRAAQNKLFSRETS